MYLVKVENAVLDRLHPSRGPQDPSLKHHPACQKMDAEHGGRCGTLLSKEPRFTSHTHKAGSGANGVNFPQTAQGDK